ncbi:hypothetical protein [Eubacterium maltosivorans]|uniref:hypothetical protein n=1 Tax=Eubacterium maltosivorans TaxID=2041044 RepID=UPI00189CFEDB|nr:hypothetical protein [Eubacterium maltosivorans]
MRERQPAEVVPEIDPGIVLILGQLREFLIHRPKQRQCDRTSPRAFLCFIFQTIVVRIAA